MKKAGIFSIMILMLAVVAFSSSTSFAATDGFYTLSLATTAWDGTDANRQKAMTTDYTYTYGDEASVTYTLPWAFSFYGQAFTEITADTNGNIWFGSSGSAHSFNLASDGRGPVIAVWNNDLSSYYYGGVFIQHKTGPERVVIEWQTETYTTEGLRRPNNFEAVLFPNGNIGLDYKAFTAATTNKDFGSGISLNDGRFVINLTTDSGNVFGLAGRSYSITPTGTLKALDVSFTGGGTGRVTSNLGVSWTASNATHFPTGAQVTLQATPDSCYKFDGWSGPCSGTGSCTFALNQDTVATAQFSPNKARIVGKGAYSTLQAAYDAAADVDVIQVSAQSLTENLTANRAVSVTIDGGYTCDYSNNPGTTVIHGAPRISAGTVKLKNIRVSF